MEAKLTNEIDSQTVTVHSAAVTHAPVNAAIKMSLKHASFGEITTYICMSTSRWLPA